MAKLGLYAARPKNYAALGFSLRGTSGPALLSRARQQAVSYTGYQPLSTTKQIAKFFRDESAVSANPLKKLPHPIFGRNLWCPPQFPRGLADVADVDRLVARSPVEVLAFDGLSGRPLQLVDKTKHRT